MRTSALLVIGTVQLRQVQRRCARQSYFSFMVFGTSAVIVLLDVLFPQVVAGIVAEWSAPSSSVLRRLSNDRARQYWDADHVLATQMKKDARAPQPEQDCCVRSDILWDLAALYPAGSVWSDQMPPAVMFNGPVGDVADAIEEAFGRNQARALSNSAPMQFADASAGRLVFLTRGGCPNTAVMRRNVDAALRSLGRTPRYEVLDQDTLPEGDLRRGYPTPTLLYADRDVFGMVVPKPPFPEPT